MKNLPNYFYPTQQKLNRFIIYALLDPITLDIRYIGKSCSGLTRIRQHFNPSQLASKSKKSNWLKSLLNKNAFPQIKILDTANDKHSLSDLERKHIRLNKTDKLLNMTVGGDGYGYVRSTQITPWNKGKQASLEARTKMRLSKLGRSFKPRSTDDKKKISESNIIAHSKNAKKFICIENNKIYNSQREAALDLNLNPANISGVLNRYKKSTGGFSFRFL